jgi:hypothetical protein
MEVTTMGTRSDKIAPRDVRIVIAQRGWVYVGEYERAGDMIELRDASVVRRWGTAAGLGQLALHGPQSETILDLAGSVSLHILAAIAIIVCDASKWPGA